MSQKKRTKVPIKKKEQSEVEELPHHIWKRRKRETLEALEQEFENEQRSDLRHGEHNT